VSRLTIIAAVADNGVIGRGGRLPWHLPEDLQRFKRLTMGHAVVMGRLTFESPEGPLPGRRVIVLSRDPRFAPEGVEVAQSLAAALKLLGNHPEVFVAGGAAVYAEAMPDADRLVLTRVRATVDGDVQFPSVDFAEWQLVEAEERPPDESNPHAMTFEVYLRRG
jgi:dihydrofolate reductase